MLKDKEGFFVLSSCIRATVKSGLVVELHLNAPFKEKTMIKKLQK